MQYLTKLLSTIARSQTATCLVIFAALSFTPAQANEPPGKFFDLKRWQITLPIDSNKDGKIDQVPDSLLPKFTFPPFFFTNDRGYMVFVSPTKVLNKDNVPLKPRSELRQMLRAGDTSIGADDEKNNFALKSNRRSRQHGSVGSRLEASLMITHAPQHTTDPQQDRAYTIIIGQVNAVKSNSKGRGKDGTGHGNEPLKIYYKKWPHHETGSIFWTYERNLPADSPNRTDIMVPVWGKAWDSKEYPDYEGIALDEEFQYVINIYQDTMELTFSADDRDDSVFTVNLANNVNAFGEVDELDNPNGYKNDSLFFRVGAYNQCTSSKKATHWTEGCTGTGDWAADYKTGDYSAVTFTKLKQGKAKRINNDK